MKIGDKVYHKKYPGIATIVHADIQQDYDIIKNKKVVRTKYIANYTNGKSIIFHGFDIGKTVFKSETISQQLSLFDSIEN